MTNKDYAKSLEHQLAACQKERDEQGSIIDNLQKIIEDQIPELSNKESLIKDLENRLAKAQQLACTRLYQRWDVSDEYRAEIKRLLAIIKEIIGIESAVRPQSSCVLGIAERAFEQDDGLILGPLPRRCATVNPIDSPMDVNE